MTDRQMRPPEFHSWIVVVVLVSLATGCHGTTIIENRGPSAGFAVVTGVVRTSAGAPASNTRVALTGCSDPIGGLLGTATTDASGAYQIHGMLPPIGLLPVDADTLRVACYAFLNFEPTARDSLSVQFFQDENKVRPQTLDITVP